ncbi:right-handed parallel beta-helix repeat-containing protein [Fibrobacter sp.]|uniref:pectate lyase family protein n=1 Tax=Fibrobacter sp. TaxID=35828 RepID=UPI0025C4ECA6|nr:right-handed parallel beta-helix repeat-containing protein [Fibrobacter sp.]MCI6437059.1 right-handed parallel beta-helix repeat-containing protein [Fibrobacter sp.]MDD7499275.1 right-handed parallel beta-helix repeat-containing protein [Fibrobacter sp.]MDY5723321.1 right-handed parallel beta-helix repeat-containing protein [Fibrobacter sp.]
MLKNLYKSLLAPALLAGSFTACSNDKNVAGGTEAESTIVALQIQVAGNHAYSRVRALPDDFLAEEATEAEWIETDENGFVKIPMEPGAYTVEARHVDGTDATGAVYSVALDSSSSNVIDTIKLVELSSIEGFVLLGESTPVIRIAGLDRYVVPDSTGHFVIDSLPTGSFEVLFGDPQSINLAKVESTTGDTLYVDCSDSVVQVTRSVESVATEVPNGDWNEHAALLAQVDGYAVGVLGAAGVTDSLGNILAAEGEICVVTTTEDYVIVEDTTEVDSAGNAKTTAVIAPGSLRECAYRDSPTWILFEKSGTYNLESPLRLGSDKTFDGRGRDVRITGMGILTQESSNLIFENLTFTAPAITVQDTSSRRALSLHNGTHHVWVDHCVFEEYPLVELDVKRGSHNVTISWSRFENAQTGVLFGLAADIIMDTAQSLTMHHNYFAGLSRDGILAHGGKLHAYNNFFDSVEKSGVVCSDAARCLIEKNVFNNELPVTLYRWYNEDGSPVDSTVGFVNMVENKFSAGGSDSDFADHAVGFVPDYKYESGLADVSLVLRLKNESGSR